MSNVLLKEQSTITKGTASQLTSTVGISGGEVDCHRSHKKVVRIVAVSQPDRTTRTQVISTQKEAVGCLSHRKGTKEQHIAEQEEQILVPCVA